MVNSISAGISSIVNKFDDWTNSEENYNKALNGEQVEDCQIFDLNLSTYSSDLKNFAQSYIDKYDSDKDASFNYSEFVNMCTNGAESAGGLKFAKSVNNFLSNKLGINIPSLQEKAALYDEMQTQFETFSFDKNADKINAGEFASVLYTADLDWDNYAQTGDVASSIDGKLNYNNYQGFSLITPGVDGYETLQGERQDFYDNFYAE